ncbi:MAG: SDR family oxidoreductase [Parvularculaceae bacterium]|nr:SDR family oxidoreductase [Parvularculaceae bacterium]
MGSTALVTGASSGIGLEFARLHAKRGGDLIAVARRKEQLDALKAEVEAKGKSTVHVIAEDLSDEASAQRIYDSIAAHGFTVDILINNAGFGGQGLFHGRDWAADRQMIQVNVVALTELTRLFLPDMIARGAGKVLNVSSTAGEVPGPLQAVYFATKAFVTSFSYALTEELKGTGVTVTALLPGATESGFASTSGMDKSSLFQSTASASSVAKAGYNAMLQGKRRIIAGVPFTRRIQYALLPFLPMGMILSSVRASQEVD